MGKVKMTETCKNCKNTFYSGIWMSPQFSDEKVLLFCSEKCRDEYIKIRLNRIKIEYPKYYRRLSKDGEEKIVENYLKDKHE